jgi:hypothetical protein
MTRLGGRLLPLVVLLCLPLGCEPPERDKSTTSSQAIFSGSRCLDFNEILPDEWQYLRNYRLDTNHDNRNEWVVLYRFDLLNEGGETTGPISAAVYQLDGNKPPSIVAHQLQPQGRDYLCECECKPTLENILSGWDGDELVFYDQCGDQISRLTIFHWDENDAKYVTMGHFCGTCIEVALDEVTVREPMQDRAQLSECKTYRAWDNRTYYQPGSNGVQVVPEREEIIFSKGEPEDVLRSPYPEKVVLAFYQNYGDDEKAPMYFAEKVRDHLGQCDAGECGCIAPRHEISRVRVTYLQPETDSQAQGADIARATVGVRVICEPRNRSPEGERFVRWHLVREEDRWQLERPE